MEPDPLSNSQTVVDRITKGIATENDFAFLRRNLIISGNQNVVQIGKYNINISQGIDNPKLQEAIRRELHSIDSNRYDQSLRDYFGALRVYSAKFPYLTLTSLVVGEQKDLGQIYVPFRMRRKMAGIYSGEQVFISQVLKQISRTPKTPHLLLLGAPGAGKSTLLRQVARCAWENPTAVGLGKPYLPIVVRLQSLALAEGVSIEEKLINALRKDSELILEQSPPQGFFEAWSSSMGTGWFLLLDGLDEVPTYKRHAMFNWLKSLQEFVRTKDCHVLLTSRSSERPGDEVHTIFEEEFITYELLSFTPEQQNSFAQQWLGERSSAFLQQLKLVRADALTKTPLFLSIAAMVFERDGYLAEQRSGLYERFVDVLLAEAEERGMWGELGTGKKSVCEGLAYLALTMTKNPEKTSLAELSTMISGDISKIFPGIKPAAIAFSEKFIEVVSQHSVVFLRQGDNYTWWHPTFREYLAANALLSTQSKHWYSFVKKNWKKEEWQETIFFFLALLSNRGVNIVRFAKQMLRKRTRRHTLARIFIGFTIAMLFLSFIMVNFLGNLEIISQIKSILIWIGAICGIPFLIWSFWDTDPRFHQNKDALFFVARLISSCKLDWEFKKQVVKQLLKETMKIPAKPHLRAPELRTERNAYARQLARYEKAIRKKEEAGKILKRIDERLLIEIYKDLINSEDDLRGAVLSKTNLSGANLSGVNLSGVNLSEINLSGADLSGADLSGASLSQANLSQAKLYKANLSQADLSDANLNYAHLSGADLSEVNLSGRYLYRADLSEANLSKTNLSGANLSKTNLSGASLSEANLRGVSLSEANLSKANLSGADLSGANLSDANLNYADLSDADLRGADLCRANLYIADLSQADLKGAYLSGAKLKVAKLRGASYSTKTIHEKDAQGNLFTLVPTQWPQGFDPRSAGLNCVDC